MILVNNEGNGITYDQITENPEAVIQKVWKPTEKQNQVLRLPDSIFECCGGGAAGGGKTDLGIMIPPIREFTNHPKFKALILRRTFADIEKEIVPRQQEWYAPMGATYNETKKVWKFLSGARIQNGHAEREQDVRKYDSAEYNYIDWDESTHFTEFQYLYLSLSRCRSSSPDLPAFVRAFTNPGNVGHGFHKQRFIKPAPRGMKIIVDKVTGQKRIFIPFLGKDNPYLSLNDPGYLKRLEGLPEIEKRAKLFGDWNSYEGQVFSEFRPLHVPGEPDNALHVIKPFPIPDWWPRILVIDWGYDAMTFAIWAAISPSGRLVIYRTWAWLKTVIANWTAECKKLSGQEVYEDFVLCHSAGQHKGEEKTIQEQVYDAFDQKYLIRLADRDRIGGKNMVHEYLRWEQRPSMLNPEIQYDQDLAQGILRKHGIEKYHEYVQMFVPQEPETNIPKLLIFSHGPEGRANEELIDVIPSCIPKETNTEDVEEFPGDDPYDALRMACKSAHRYVEQSSEEMKRRARIQKVLDELHQTQNQTAFYLNMEKMEAEDNEPQSVRGGRRLGSRRVH